MASMKIKRFCGNIYDPYADNAQMCFIESYDSYTDLTGDTRKKKWDNHVKYYDNMIKGKARFSKNVNEKSKENMIGLYCEMTLFDFIIWKIWFFITFKIFLHTKFSVWLITHEPKERRI